MEKGGGNEENRNVFNEGASSNGSFAVKKGSGAIPEDMQSETSYFGKGSGAIPADMMSETSYIIKGVNNDMQSEVSYM